MNNDSQISHVFSYISMYECVRMTPVVVFLQLEMSVASQLPDTLSSPIFASESPGINTVTHIPLENNTENLT
jgi:hypothetical protein